MKKRRFRTRYKEEFRNQSLERERRHGAIYTRKKKHNKKEPEDRKYLPVN